MEPYLKHLATLGLEPGASPAEVRRAYTELSSVWDPDQFEQGAPLHTQARQQIVKLDQAFHFLMARFTDEEGVPGPSITRRLFSPNPGEAPARRAADSEDSPEPEPPVARARRTTRRPPARKREKGAQAARSPSKLVRRSATVAALALVAFIVVQNPSFSGVRATAISVRESIDRFGGSIARTTWFRRIAFWRVDIPEELEPYTRGYVVESVPSLSQGQVRQLYGAPLRAGRVQWVYPDFSVLFLDSMALLLVRDTASADEER